MGTSPGKWIKRVIFGKKSSGTQTSKGRDPLNAANGEEHVGGTGPSAQAVNSPVISQPVLVNTKTNDIISEPEKGTPADMVVGGVPSSIGQHTDDQGIVGHDVLKDSEKVEEQQAATMVQAAFRGYLSRRAFHALKGIIRLQALVRGHLVRRQAVVTLRSFQGIVKLQALIRGRRVRLEVNTKCHQGRDVDAEQLKTWNEKLLTNTFIRQLLSASPVIKPLQIEYDGGEPNSVLSWMERWTSSHFWKPLPQPMKAVDLKFQASESSRLKYTLSRNSVANTDSGPVNAVTEPEKPKCNLRKVPSSPADSVQEHPQTELEKVKHNLSKVSNLTTEASDWPDAENEKPTHSLKKVPGSPPDVTHQSVEVTADKMKKGTAVTPENKPDMECTLPDDWPPLELHSLQNTSKEGELSVTNGELSLKDEQPCEGSQKGRKRRASFSSKSEYYAEHGLQNASKLPSYMQTTESAKAKLRGQVLPRSGSDSAVKNSTPRRHSLPSSMNGKLSSQSPRTQKLIQGSGKGAIRNDRSLTSSIDEKAIQIEWRR
ncbi:protein IQ-DOMAIN 31-like isoform X2 [Phoenix dactylifera]|uniref:Protein IQ-DOMAIN 31-like isoform X2 n=1 Tax=Phoenix dactylifera TaxID=42345 RepID=A0A8B7BWA2_PHODC|nr:protein IQ-DOMAIN 31-like isoform X2 [Phoenix dactylifera]XP_008786657.2 protein IQ-DOMAIN 31-like isoform X2 [Phoenix dactylifera]